LSKDLAPMDKGNDKELARLRSMNQRLHDDMKWIISFGDDGWCLYGINIGGYEMKCVRQRDICTAFHFTGLSWVEKCLTGFRIYSRTIKRENLLVATVI